MRFQQTRNQALHQLFLVGVLGLTVSLFLGSSRNNALVESRALEGLYVSSKSQSLSLNVMINANDADSGT